MGRVRNQKIRKELFEEQNGKCALCGCQLHLDKSKPLDMRYLQIDHIKPKSMGGQEEKGNYRGLCRGCNASRNNISGDRLIEVMKYQLENIMVKNPKRGLDHFALIIDDLNHNNLTIEQVKELRDYFAIKFKENLEALDKIIEGVSGG